MALNSRWGPSALALAFGLMSVPFVALTLMQRPPGWQQSIVDAPLIDWPQALSLALVSVVVASLVGGTLGSQLVRSRPVAAVLVAIATAWPVGIGMLSIAAAILGVRLETAILCIDTCTPEITSQDPVSGFTAYGTSVFAGAIFVVPPAAAIVLGLLAWWLARRRRAVASMVLTVLAYGALHLLSVLDGGSAFVCLALGVTIWAVLLRQDKPVDERGGHGVDVSPSVEGEAATV